MESLGAKPLGEFRAPIAVEDPGALSRAITQGPTLSAIQQAFNDGEIMDVGRSQAKVDSFSAAAPFGGRVCPSVNHRSSRRW